MSDYIRQRNGRALFLANDAKRREILEKRKMKEEMRMLREEINMLKAMIEENLAKRT